MTRDMPGRIYAWLWNGDAHRGQWCTNAWVGEFRGAVEYVLASRLAEVEVALKATLEREAETYRRNDARAEAAEARLAEVEAECDMWKQRALHQNGVANCQIERAEAAEAERDALAAKLALAMDALKGFASWNHCWPGNINLEAECRKASAALTTITADTPKEGKDDDQ